jgi:hypothetical protein
MTQYTIRTIIISNSRSAGILIVTFTLARDDPPVNHARP